MNTHRSLRRLSTLFAGAAAATVAMSCLGAVAAPSVSAHREAKPITISVTVVPTHKEWSTPLHKEW